VGGSEAKKRPGSDLFFEILCGVFELPSPRNAQTQKRDKQNRGGEKNSFGILSIFWLKLSMHFFAKRLL
jgi:hypothetical protein